MTQVVIDSNVLVSFLTDRNPAQQELAAALLSSAADGEPKLILPQSVILELVFVLSNVYDLAAPAVAAAVADLLDLPGVTVHDELAWPLVLELWPQTIAGFGDAVIAAVARRGHYDAIATFDLKLRRALPRIGIRSHW